MPLPRLAMMSPHWPAPRRATLILVEPAVHLKKHLTPALIRTALAMHLLRRLHGDAADAECFLRWAHGYRAGGSALERFSAPVRQSIRDMATPLSPSSTPAQVRQCGTSKSPLYAVR